MRSFVLQDCGYIGRTAVAGKVTLRSANHYTTLQSGWTVPTGVASVTVKAWGGGGGGFPNGGNGSYLRGTFPVVPGNTVYLRANYGLNTGALLGGGYAGAFYPSLAAYTTALVAGGGGAGGNDGGTPSNGGSAGANGSAGQTISLGAGAGATSGAGGAAGVFPGVAGSFLQGGSSSDAAGDGGGGGAGWYGGGGGGSDGINISAGGGGSSFASGCASPINTGPDFSDPDWNRCAGLGLSGESGIAYLLLHYS